MWSRFTGKSDSGSSAPRKEDDEVRRRRSDTTRSKRDRDSDTRSVVSSTSTRKPSTRRTDSTPSTIASYATAFDDMPRSRAPTNDDLYDDPRDDRDRRSSYAESSAPTARDGKDKEREKGWRRSSKDSKKSEKRKSMRAQSQASGSRGDIVEEPRPLNRSFSGQIGSEGFSQFPGQAGAPMMSGALPVGSQSPHPSAAHMSSHVQDQFPGQDPVQFSSSAMPGHNPFGAAADFYMDQGQSVDNQPGVRPQPPSVIVGQDTPHLMAAAARANPVADTGAGSAADFYGASTNPPASSSKPPRPTSMPGAFVDDSSAPQKPPRPSGSKPLKTNSFPTTAAGLAGGAALGYAMGHSSSNTQHSTSYSTSNVHHSTSYSDSHPHDTSYNNTPAGPSGPSSVYHLGDMPSTAAINGSYSNLHQESTAGAPHQSHLDQASRKSNRAALMLGYMLRQVLLVSQLMGCIIIIHTTLPTTPTTPIIILTTTTTPCLEPSLDKTSMALVLRPAPTCLEIWHTSTSIPVLFPSLSIGGKTMKTSRRWRNTPNTLVSADTASTLALRSWMRPASTTTTIADADQTSTTVPRVVLISDPVMA